ncbi:MAG: putative sulfate exporter family transporter [Planctomycetota bacterium]
MESSTQPDDPASDELSAIDGEASRPNRISDDWLAIVCAGVLLIVCFAAVAWSRPSELPETDSPAAIESPLKGWIGKPGSWEDRPLESLWKPAVSLPLNQQPITGVLGAFASLGVLFSFAVGYQRGQASKFCVGFIGVFVLATIAYVLAAQTVVKDYNLEYALWALALGLIISNTIGTPTWLKPAVLTEFYIKTGLVLLGAEVLFSRLLALGLPGVFVAWVVTPIVLISTYVFGQKVLRMESRSLNMVIAADMSVCGVSAAIAAAASCKAKKEELSLAIGMSLSFTVLMMVVMPLVIRAIGMDEIIAGAWMGGTIDSTGAVAAAGATVGEKAEEVAATIKMIQNILIGVSAFGIATYWVTAVERDSDRQCPRVSEVWRRFPRFVLGFLAASIGFSLIHGLADGGPEMVNAMIKQSTKGYRGWCFCLAFISIGLETHFRSLLPYLRGGKPLVLYVCGQSLNIILTLAMAYLMFGIVFRDFVREFTG